MTTNVYSIRDDVSGSFGNLFAHYSDEVAIRFFKFTLSRSEGIEHDFPNDFTLYRVGSFNFDTGEITAELPTVIIKGSDSIV